MGRGSGFVLGMIVVIRQMTPWLLGGKLGCGGVVGLLRLCVCVRVGVREDAKASLAVAQGNGRHLNAAAWVDIGTG